MSGTNCWCFGLDAPLVFRIETETRSLTTLSSSTAGAADEYIVNLDNLSLMSFTVATLTAFPDGFAGDLATAFGGVWFAVLERGFHVGT